MQKNIPVVRCIFSSKAGDLQDLLMECLRMYLRSTLAANQQDGKT